MIAPSLALPKQRLALTFALATLALGQIHAQIPRTTTLSEKKDYTVNITTSFDFPKKSEFSRVLVQHTIPTARPWTKMRQGMGAKSIKNSPNGYKVHYDRTLDTTVVEWIEPVPTKGGPLSFTTTYEVPTVSRNLRPEAFKRTRWTSRSVPPDGNEELRKLAEKILKEEPNAAAGLARFSQWLPERIKYDDSVINKDVEETLKNGAGHCGHRAAVFAEFCRMVSIPTRFVYGMHLQNPDGKSQEKPFNPSTTNLHTWVEVNLPLVGWVEVEPTKGKDLFNIPDTYIQTKGFQNSKIKLLQRGKWVDPTWKIEKNPDNPEEKPTEVSPIGLKTTVSFENSNPEAP